MGRISKDSRCYATCCCQNVICGVVLLVIGVVAGITGCIVAAVGFGQRPDDMYDQANIAMRVAGLSVVGIAILPVAISICCWIFFCAFRHDSERHQQGGGASQQPYVFGVQDQMIPLSGQPVGQPKDGMAGGPIYHQPPPYNSHSFRSTGSYDDDSSTATPLKLSSANSEVAADTHSRDTHVVMSGSSLECSDQTGVTASVAATGSRQPKGKKDESKKNNKPKSDNKKLQRQSATMVSEEDETVEMVISPAHSVATTNSSYRGNQLA
jgi:hypothetical protein